MSESLRGRVWLKCDFHVHTAEDPHDELEHACEDVLMRAHTLGFGALAITLHRHVLTRPELFAKARDLGILLIPSAELHIENADVVVLNLDENEARSLRTFDDLRALRGK